MSFVPILSIMLCLAAGPARAGAGVAGADILKVPVEARGWGLGMAYSALADDSGSMTYNPAGLSLGRQREFRFTHLTALENSFFDSILLSTPVGRWGAIGAMFLMHHVPGIDNEGDAFYPLQGIDHAVTVSDTALGGYIACRFSHLLPSIRFLSPLSLGLGLKSVNMRVATLTANATAVDFGFLLALEPTIVGGRRQLRLALVGQNFGGGFSFPGTITAEADALPQTVRLGCAIIPYEDSKSSLSLSLDNSSYVGVRSKQKFGDEVRTASEKLNVLSWGVEYWRLARMAVRFGYVTPWGAGAGSYEAARGLALGGTFRVYAKWITYQFDLAYRPIYLGTSVQDGFSISLGVRF